MQWMDLMSNEYTSWCNNLSHRSFWVSWCTLDVVMSWCLMYMIAGGSLHAWGSSMSSCRLTLGQSRFNVSSLEQWYVCPRKCFKAFRLKTLQRICSVHYTVQPTALSCGNLFLNQFFYWWLNVSCNIHAWSIGFPTSRTQYPKCCVHFATALVSAQIKNDGLGSFARPIEECKLGHIGRVQLGPITTHTTEIRLKDFHFRLATVHQGQFAHKEWQPCQFELLKRHLSHKSGKVKPVKSNPFKSTQNPNLVMRCFLYHKVANENATESPWHACLSASCPGSELLKAVAMRPIRLTAQQAKGGTLKSSFFNWNHWKILVHWYE